MLCNAWARRWWRTRSLSRCTAPCAAAAAAVVWRRAIDEGTSPDTFTVQLFRDSLAQNQARCVGGCVGGAGGVTVRPGALPPRMNLMQHSKRSPVARCARPSPFA